MSFICITRTPSTTPSNTPTITPCSSSTATPTPSTTNTNTPAVTPTPTNTITTSETPTLTPTLTPSNTLTCSPTSTKTPSPTSSPTPSYAWIKRGKFIGRAEGSDLIFEESLYGNEAQGFIKTIPDNKIVCAKIIKMGDGEFGASIIDDIGDLLDNAFITSPYNNLGDLLSPLEFWLSDGNDPPFFIRKSEQIIVDNKLVGYKYILTIQFSETIEAILTKYTVDINTLDPSVISALSPEQINTENNTATLECKQFYIEYILLGTDEFFPTPSPTITNSPTTTPTVTKTPTNTPSVTVSSTPPVTPTKTTSQTPPSTETRTPTKTLTPTITNTTSNTPTLSSTPTPTETIFFVCTRIPQEDNDDTLQSPVVPGAPVALPGENIIITNEEPTIINENTPLLEEELPFMTIDLPKNAQNPTNEQIVEFTIILSEPTISLNINNFSLLLNGISQASILETVGGEGGTSWSVFADTGVGAGLLSLEFTDEKGNTITSPAYIVR